MDTKAAARRLASKYDTRDPFAIADDLGCIVMYVRLKKLRGFYRYMKRCHIIFINDSLDEVQRRLVCAHELGHMLLHRGLNRFFMDSRTFVVTGKYELDAHHFAVDLIYSDEELLPFLPRPISDAAQYMGVPTALAEYRMRSVPRPI